MRITVIGNGYLGAVHAACMAEIGHQVLGVEADKQLAAALASGRVPFFEPCLDTLLTCGIGSGKLRFGMSLQQAAEFGEVHFICVGTPQRTGSWAADTGGVEKVVEELGPLLRRPCLVVGKSTVPAGTASRLAGRLAEVAPVGGRAELAWNPEFLREGLAVRDTLQPDRLVAGVTSARADAMLRAVYAPLISAGIPYISTDLTTAELAKVAANAFLATKISFINAIADLCEAAGADVVTLAQALGHDGRIGHRGLSAGLGFGGGCLPKDLHALLASGEELGVADSLSFLHAVDAVNMRRRKRAIAITREMLGGSLDSRQVAVLGAAFKPGTDDVRDSPALAVAAALHLEGAEVRINDPAAIERALGAFPHLTYETSVLDTCAGADVVLHLTEWPQYRVINPVALGSVVRRRRLLDARNALPLDRWVAAGWTVRSFGARVAGPGGGVSGPREQDGGATVPTTTAQPPPHGTRPAPPGPLRLAQRA